MSPRSVPRNTTRPVRLAVALVIGVVTVVLLPLVQVAPASASPIISSSFAVVPDGSPMLLTGSSTSGEVGATPSFASPIVLGAPTDAAQPVVLGWNACAIAGMVCPGIALVRKVHSTAVSTGQCVVQLSDCAADIAQKVFSTAIKGLVDQIVKGFKNGVIAVMDMTINMVIRDELGGQGGVGEATRPIVDCNVATGVTADVCAKDPKESQWFLSEFAIMRQLGFLMIVPLLMLMVIQSVLRGSLVFMMRAFLVMLPVAILMTVASVTILQLLLNIVDGLTRAMVMSLLDTEGYGARFRESLNGMSNETFGLWGIVWSLFFMAAALTIFVELVLRSLGVYLVAMFFPLAFAGLVWTVTMPTAIHAVKAAVGLAAAPFFVGATLVTGASGFAQSNLANVNMADSAVVQQLASGQQTPVQYGSASLFAGGALFFMAAFAPIRIYQLFKIQRPANASPSNLLQRGQVASITLTHINTGLGNAARRRAGP